MSRASAALPSNSLTQFMAEIGPIPLLTADQEVALGRLIEEGTAAAERLAAGATGPDAHQARATVRRAADARAAMIRSNLRLVVSIARRYQHRGLPLADLVQEGTIGLIRAVDKFDYRRGFKFCTYASWWIRQAVSRGLANKARLIRLPANRTTDRSRLAGVRASLAQALGREPSTQEIAAGAGLKPELVTHPAPRPRPDLAR